MASGMKPKEIIRRKSGSQENVGVKSRRIMVFGAEGLHAYVSTDTQVSQVY